MITSRIHYRRRVAWLVALALLVLSASVASATIGPKKEMQGYYQQSSNTTSANGVVESTCSNNTSCHVLFQKIPDGKQLVVTQVSCWLIVVWIADEGDVVVATLFPRRPDGAVLQRDQHLVTSRTGLSNYVANGNALQLLDAKDIPVIRVRSNFAGNFDTVQCTISGQIADAPP